MPGGRSLGCLAAWSVAVLLVWSTSTLAAAGKVTLSLEASGDVAARGGMMPLDVFALIEPGWHINAHTPTETDLIATAVALTLPPGITAEPIQYPPPDLKTFAFVRGKALRVYQGKLGMATALHVPVDFHGSQARIAATLRYQACSDSTCLPPTTATAELVIRITSQAGAASVAETAKPSRVSTGNSIGRWLDERGLVFTLLAVALLGIGLNLTPCVYPLISVTVAYFGGHDQRRTSRTALLAAIYVLGIALSFAALGMVAAVSGGLFGAALQRPAVTVFVAGVMVMLSLSSFGLYQLRPPPALMQWAGGASHGVAGAAFMGLTMGIVAAPCIGPLVLALLVAVGARQDPLVGFLLFFALGCGMGLPYLLLAVVAGSIRQLPRSGEWLVWTERLFGFLLLGMAAYFVGPLLPHPLRELLLPLVMAIAGVYLGFIDPSGHTLRAFRGLKQGLGLAALALAFWIAWPPRTEGTIQWRELTPSVADALPGVGRPRVIDFVAAWCIPCAEMARTTFVDSKVVHAATDFDMLQADITTETEDTKRLLERFEVRGVPTVLVFDATGREIGRMVGYTEAPELLAAMDKALSAR